MSQLEERYGGHGRTSEDNISARQPLPLWGAVFMEVATIEWTREGRCDLTALIVSLPREHRWHATVSVSPLGKEGNAKQQRTWSSETKGNKK